jgi:hypothetical protein
LEAVLAIPLKMSDLALLGMYLIIKEDGVLQLSLGIELPFFACIYNLLYKVNLISII